MVKLTAFPLWQQHNSLDAATWLASLDTELQQDSRLQEAAHYAALVGHDQRALGGISCWQQGLSMADTLLTLKADVPLLVAALLYPTWHYSELDEHEIDSAFGPTVSQLLVGTEKMDAVRMLHGALEKTPSQIENCRKMLLAMATDLRVVLLKLVERLHALRASLSLSESQRYQLGEEIMLIYAPLANRLGLGQLKWEMEDLAFRATHPSAYKDIAQQLDQRRVERDTYIADFKQQLHTLLTQHGIEDFQLSGRAKHIYSIYRKIQRKGLAVKDLYDISAFRVLVPDIESCYRSLDIIQQHFEMVDQEFDDYIAQPKANGYQSIHTAIIGPNQQAVEIQIRTFAMHQSSELGVAAHWRYKEGGASNQSYEAKIAWLRELLSWQDEISQHHPLSDRIYVFTPQGEIIDLPPKATPVDFAYFIHTNVGHRCRGAKINDQIVPLTTPLKMADRVEILTSKTPQPSRDWLNPQLAYVTTARARSKILHWFKNQDFDKHAADGKSLVDKELKRFHLNDLPHESLSLAFHYPTTADFYAALGSGQLKLGQLTSRLQTHLYQSTTPQPLTQKSVKIPDSGIVVEGVGSLLSHPAKCCNPVPGDAIAGYITLKQGVAIHRAHCAVFLSQSRQHPEQVLTVYWGKTTDEYPLQLTVLAQDRPGLTRDLTTVINHQKITLVDLKTRPANAHQQIQCDLTVLITSLNNVDYLLAELARLPNILQVQRKG